MSYKCPVCGKEFGDLYGLNECVGAHANDEKRRDEERAAKKRLQEEERALSELDVAWERVRKLQEEYRKAYDEVAERQKQYNRQFGVKTQGDSLWELFNALSF